MTTGNAPALPAATDDNLPPVTPPAADAAPSLTFTSPQPPDSDDAELTEALAQAKAEEADGSGAGQPATPPQDPAAQPGATAPAAAPNGQNPPAPPAPAPVMIPKARLDEALRALDEQRLSTAKLQGMLEATRPPAQPAPGATPPQPQQTPAQRLDAIYQAQDALAARFDAGEITQVDLTKEQRKLNNAEQTIREESLRATLQPAAAPAPNDELYLETLTTKLETDHPWVVVFDKAADPADWKFLELTAIQNIQGRGQSLDMKKTIDRYQFRKEMAELATQYGPSLVAGKATAKGIALPGQPQRQQQQPPVNPGTPPPLSPAAQARLTDLQKRAGAPPDIASLPGHGSDPAGLPTELALEAMTDDDFDKLPSAVVNRLRGV